jgi:GTPase
MLPVITLIGRPNVGKSTLFNRLTRTRDALVADFPGLTRDRQYGIGRIGPRPYVIVDTGGIGSAAEGVEALMERQVQRAVEEADHLLFLVDTRDGCTPEDIDIAQRLRRLGKPITLVVNKSDTTDPTLAVADFHRLGLGDPWAASATQGLGVRGLIDHVFEHLPPEARTRTRRRTGRPDQGRGRRTPERGQVHAHQPHARRGASGRLRQPGTTRDSIFIPFERPDDQRYTLIDTAGLRRRARVMTRSRSSASSRPCRRSKRPTSSSWCWMPMRASPSRTPRSPGISESGRALVVAINKWDGLDPDARDRVRDQFARKLAFLDFAKLHHLRAARQWCRPSARRRRSGLCQCHARPFDA